MGKNAFHLPTMKTHVFTTITGAMKNAFGGLLNENRHWTHAVIHETLVDLLRIQKEIHPGIFCVTDGTIAGEGAGPRAMVPHIKNYILASGDSVAVDAVSAKMQGFDPLSIRFIGLAHELGLGCGDPREMEILGEDVEQIDFGFERMLLRTKFVPWSYAASRAYHDLFWYRTIGRSRVRRVMRTEWGKLFKQYG
jgi:uncharacterized protein (DUF362 family)